MYGIFKSHKIATLFNLLWSYCYQILINTPTVTGTKLFNDTRWWQCCYVVVAVGLADGPWAWVGYAGVAMPMLTAFKQ